MPAPADLFAQIQGRKTAGTGGQSRGLGNRGAMLEQMMTGRGGGPTAGGSSSGPSPPPTNDKPEGKPSWIDFSENAFVYDEAQDAFMFAAHHHLKPADSYQADDRLTTPILDEHEIVVPLAQCVYRMTDYTYAKKEPVLLERCLLKLGVLRCLARECRNLNILLSSRFGGSGKVYGVLPALPHFGDSHASESTTSEPDRSKSSTVVGLFEEDELAKTRFMELLSNCGVYQKVSELILQQCARAPMSQVPQVRVDALEEFLSHIEQHAPSLQLARNEISQTSSVSFYPGLGELFTPGSQLTCYPGGMEGTPLGCQVVQCWYDQEVNPATQKTKRRFILVVEFIVSVGDELVFVAASDVYPEFHDPNRNLPIKDLTHRKLDPIHNSEDRQLFKRLQQRGEFYASVATKNHYLEYHSNSFFPIIGGGWSSNAVRPLSKGGRVMVDVKRGILEGHLPVRASDGMSDTVKEAIKLFEQSKRTGVAVPFRTCILPGFDGLDWTTDQPGDRPSLWQAWPMLTGFSFTARVWGKLLLGMPKISRTTGEPIAGGSVHKDGLEHSPKRAAQKKLGVAVAALGGVGSCSNCGYIHFQEKAFDLLVLAEDKKELIRAVARNAGGGQKSHEGFDDEEEDEDDVGIDVVANKGGASIFLLHGPPGCGKTLTAEGTPSAARRLAYFA